jgi:hypothetical protein
MDKKLELKAQIEEHIEMAKALIGDFTIEGDRRFRDHLYKAKQLKWELCFLEVSDSAKMDPPLQPQEFTWYSDGIFHNLVLGNVKESQDERTDV